MRPKVISGTCSIACAVSVSPTSWRHLGSSKPARITNVQSEIQIVDTHECLESPVVVGYPALLTRMSGTLLVPSIEFRA